MCALRVLHTRAVIGEDLYAAIRSAAMFRRKPYNRMATLAAADQVSRRVEGALAGDGVAEVIELDPQRARA